MRSKKKRQEDKMWAVFRFFVVILVCLIAFIIYLTDTLDISPNREFLLERQIPSVIEHYPKALAEARNWRSDAYMIYSAIQIRGTVLIGSLAFNSESNPEVGFLYRLHEAEEGYQLETKEVDASGRLKANPPIPEDKWTVDSLEAYRVAIENGGSDFINLHPEVDTALLQLDRLSGSASSRTGLPQGEIVWVVTFYKLMEISMDIYIDALTGEVLATDVQEGGLDIEQLNLGDDA
jgi:hypothetical protein